MVSDLFYMDVGAEKKREESARGSRFVSEADILPHRSGIDIFLTIMFEPIVNCIHLLKMVKSQIVERRLVRDPVDSLGRNDQIRVSISDRVFSLGDNKIRDVVYTHNPIT